MSGQRNQREWTRIDHALDVTVTLDDGTTLEGTTRNLSANGFLIEGVMGVKPGAAGEVCMARHDPEGSLVIRGRGEVVRSDDRGTAVTLTLLNGEESYTAIRNLIVYNAAEDAAQAEQEFQDHIGLRKRNG